MTNTKQDIVLIEFHETGIPFHESFSPFCLKVHRTLQYLGLPYTVDREGRPDTIKKVNPKGQLPVMRIGDEYVSDSTNIVTRLESHTGISLSGTSARMGADARLWEEMADSAVYGFVVSARWSCEENWPRVREALFGGIPKPLRGLISGSIRKRVVSGTIARDVWRGGPSECWSRLDGLLDDFDTRLEGSTFFLGDTLTRADIALFAQLQSFRTSLTPRQKTMVESREHLTAWLDRVDLATRARTVTEARAA